jgi:hypothetical protein
MRLRIAEAVALYNSRHTKQMTMTSLAQEVIPDREDKRPEDIEMMRKKWLMSRWNNGTKFGTLTPDIINNIAKKTGTSPNFLFGWKSNRTL